MIAILYIHKLSDFQRKSADVESVYLVREIKQKMSFPLQESKMSDFFAEFFISDSDRSAMETALSTVPAAIEQVKALLLRNSFVHERVNLQRTVALLEGLPDPLFNNIAFAQNIADWQGQFIKDATVVLNQIPRLRTNDEKAAYNQKISQMFERLLRNKDFSFNAWDIVHEKQVAEMQGLLESMGKGFFFHVSLEEELRKADFGSIRSRIPSGELAPVQEIEQNLQVIHKGVTRAYDANMRMVNCALVLYAYVKWMMNV